jgi:hypothetical protein
MLHSKVACRGKPRFEEPFREPLKGVGDEEGNRL